MKLIRARIPRFNGRRIALAIVAFALVVPADTALFSSAAAQDDHRQQRGLFDLLFGGGLRQRQPERPAVKKRRAAPREKKPVKRRSRKRSSARQSPPTPPPPTEVKKLENARVVLVVGDFLAGGLAEGLNSAYAESPGVHIVNRSNGSSGFVRDDYYDWNSEIGGMLDEVSPTVVVVMIGSNDRQQLVVNGRRQSSRTEPWVKEYTRRVETFASSIREKEVPVIWTGLPSFKSPRMSSDMLAFNDIYKSSVEKIGGEFVDIWDGFVGENGNFISTGPDMNGQPVRLRGSDGINLTRAGRRKVAFYVEKPLNKLLGEAVSPDIGELGMENLPKLVLHPENPEPVNRTIPISLSDPALDGGTELMGAEVKPIARQELEQEGSGLSAPPGRADNFSLRSVPKPVKQQTPPDPSVQTTP